MVTTLALLGMANGKMKSPSEEEMEVRQIEMGKQLMSERPFVDTMNGSNAVQVVAHASVLPVRTKLCCVELLMK